MKDCKKCNGMVVLNAFSESQCKNCGCVLITPHIPSYKYCKDCAEKLNVCQQCGTEKETNTPEIKPEDLRIDVFRPPFKGMHVQCLPSYVKVEHIPSGIVVTKCERSQLRAKEKCLAEIKKLLEAW